MRCDAHHSTHSLLCFLARPGMSFYRYNCFILPCVIIFKKHGSSITRHLYSTLPILWFIMPIYITFLELYSTSISIERLPLRLPIFGRSCSRLVSTIRIKTKISWILNSYITYVVTECPCDLVLTHICTHISWQLLLLCL